MKKKILIFLPFLLVVLDYIVTLQGVDVHFLGITLSPLALNVVLFISMGVGLCFVHGSGSLIDALLIMSLLMSMFAICLLSVEYNLLVNLLNFWRWFWSAMIGSFVTFVVFVGMVAIRKQGQY